jgi:hypothetical protein
MLASKLKSPEIAKTKNWCASFLGLFIQLKSKIFYTLETFALFIIFRCYHNLDLETSIIWYIGAALAIVSSLLVEVFTLNIIAIRLIMAEDVSWCHSRSLYQIFKSIVKFSQGVGVLIQSSSTFVNTQHVLVLICLLYYLYVYPFHSAVVCKIEQYSLTILYFLNLSLIVQMIYEIDPVLQLVLQGLSFLTPFITEALLDYRVNQL